MMRFIASFTTAACALTLAAAPALKAEPASADDQVTSDAQSDTPDDAAAVVGYNRWICYAQPYGFSNARFYGYSEWFMAGSGMGQQAHNYAYNRALNNCDRRYYRRCYSDFSRDCYVDRQ